MKNLFFFLLVISGVVWGQQKEITVNGKVTDGMAPISDVNITVPYSEKGTKTDAAGFYKITVNEGAILNYSHVGYENVEIVTEDVDRALNIIMVPKINQLDNVTVTKTKPRKTQKELFQEYNTNPNLIKTMFGILDKETSATALYVLDEEDFPPGALDVVDLINGRIPAARGYKPTADPATWFIAMRGNGSINFSKNSIYEIDGLVFEEFPYWLDVPNIKRIATMPSLAGVLKYGSMANGGLVVINTKTGNFSPGANGIPVYDQAKIRDNVYDNSALQAPIDEAKLRGSIYANELVSDNLMGESPTYLNLLLESKNELEAKDIYENQKKMYGSSYYFILDAYDYFSNRWENREFADSIIKQSKGILENNSHALKALAYVYQAEGRYKKANDLYKEIFILRPNYAQSYMDLANSYQEIEEHQKAAAIFGRYGYLVEEGFLSTKGELGTIMSRELNNLITLNWDKELSKRELKKLVWKDEFEGTRLVFEWNDSEAEFKLQFVNPEGSYYTSEHSLLADADRIKEEKIAGFSCEEYLMYGFIGGVWQVNVTYLGNKSLTPTYIKASIYHNYGTTYQRKETKVFKLSLKNVNQFMFKVSNASRVVSN